jgi:hypothetical protein
MATRAGSEVAEHLCAAATAYCLLCSRSSCFPCLSCLYVIAFV